MAKKIAGVVLLLLAIAATGAAILTLIPAHTSHKSDLGYFSLCPFAPWSTLMLAVVAGIVWVVRGYVLTRTD